MDSTAAETPCVQPPVESVPEALASSAAAPVDEEDLTAKFTELLKKTTEE